MNRLIGLFVSLAIALWAQRTLTGSQPGIARDALLLFILAGVIFVWNALPPQPLRQAGEWLARPWPRRGRLLSLAGLAVGVVSLALLWIDLGSLPGLLLWPAAAILFVAGTALEARGGGDALPSDESITHHASRFALRPWLNAHWDLLLLALILLVSAFVRFNQLSVFPNGCQSDECNNGLDALKWLGGAGYRPYAETNEGQATLFTYLIALSFQVFGVGVTQMRAVSALVGVLTVGAFYLLARDLYGRRAALAATALLATARWHVTFSRIVYELIMQPGVMILLALFLLRALRTGKRWQWALAGVLLALGMNTYTAFRVVPFIVAAFLAFWIVRAALIARARSRRGDESAAARRAALRHDLQGIALLAGAAFTAVLPLGVYIVQNWDVFTGRMRHISILNDVERLGSVQPIVENFKKTLYMFNWQGDQAALNNLPGAPMLDTLAALLFVLGLAYALWYALRARSAPVLYVLWFAGILSLGVLSVAHEAPTARRTIGMIPLVYLLVALVVDQLLRAWRIAWRGVGQRVFDVGVVAVVAVVMLANARVYFQVQAPDPSVWAAFSPNESAVGRFLASLPSDSTVLITPQYEHHSAVKLIGRDHPYRALNPVDDVPYRGPASQDLVYILEPVDRPLLTLLQQIYPAGAAEEHLDRYGQNLFLSYRIAAADLAATQGLTGQFFSAYPPTTAANAVQAAPALDLDLAAAPLPAPFFALWEGTLLAPAYGQYRFDFEVESGPASVQIGRDQRLDLNDGGQGQLEATLAAGFHPIRVEVQSGEAPGRLRLTWSGPGFDSTVVGGDALYTFRLGDQGLVGYYYPNASWEGPPALVRNDLLITPNNPLREPFSILWRGKLAVPTTGVYTIGTRSDDGSFVHIDGQLVVDNGGSHGAEDRSGQIALEQGFHDIEVRYNELGGSREMQLWWQPPGQGRAVIDSQFLFPLEGDEIPAGLAVPPPPEIALPFVRPDTGAAEPPAPPPVSGAAPVTQPAGDFSVLPATVLWTFGGGVCGAGLDQLASPRGVAIDPASGDVFVADTGNSRIVRLDAGGQFVASWDTTEAGLNPAVGEESAGQEVVDLAVEPGGAVVVLDAVGQQLLRFTPDGQFTASFGVEQTFYRPRGLGIDAAGQIAVADTGGVRIVRLDPSGALQSQAGGPDSDLARQQPTDAALTPGGDLYFVEAESGAITRLAADGSLTRWGGPALASTIDGPHLAVLPAGGLTVSDPEGRRVLLFTADGQPLGQFGAEAGLVKPVGIAAAPGKDGSVRVAVVDSQMCSVVMFEVNAP